MRTPTLIIFFLFLLALPTFAADTLSLQVIGPPSAPVILLKQNMIPAEVEVYKTPDGTIATDGPYISGDLIAVGPYCGAASVPAVPTSELIKPSGYDGNPVVIYQTTNDPKFGGINKGCLAAAQILASKIPGLISGTRYCATVGDAEHGGNHTNNFACFTAP